MTDDGALFDLPDELAEERDKLLAAAEKARTTKRLAIDERCIKSGKSPISTSAGYSVPLRHPPDLPCKHNPNCTCGGCKSLYDGHVSGQKRCAYWGGSTKSTAAEVNPEWPACTAYAPKEVS